MGGVFTHRLGVFNQDAGNTDGNFASTVLLLGFNGSDGSTTFTDESFVARGNATVFGNAQVDTAQSKYDGASGLFDGTGDYLEFANSADFNFANGAFTVEFFVRFNSVGTDIAFVGIQDGSANGWRITRNGGNLIFQGDNGTATTGNAWTPSTGQWYHIAADREAGSTLRVYVDGVLFQKAATLGAALDNSTLPLRIGRLPSAPIWDFNGWMDELRITKGVARYASDGGFTVPAAAYPRS